MYPSVPTDSQSQIMQPTIASRARSTEPESPIHFVQQDRLIFVEDKNGQFLLSASRRDVTALKGMFGKPARVVSIEEMNEAIRTCGAAAR
ncbi:MAG: AbrB family transcriptional regulator [Lautropia sp.]|nr:MAG: AbrB family transcriptional regulator [Lautropia sp.]